ncbi:hypothetical protein [Erythrobacter donghaensis]|uniref:hypothetical protein n=1 Tax=Erythrobacter donghaensis TaxID=267135 RepID=UPI00117FC59D|nr:hypothetical protein [Erythrobacter donghaensis]
MPLSALLVPLLAAQIVFEPRPVPPPAPLPGSEWYEQQAERYRRDLAAECISPAGIEVILTVQARDRLAASSEPQEWRIHQQAVAQAAWAEPFDAEVFAKAVRAEAAFRAEREIAMAEANLATLSALSGRDREIYAHRMTTEVKAGYRKPC